MKKGRLILLLSLITIGISIGSNAQDCVKTVRCSRLDSAMKNEKRLLIAEKQLGEKKAEVDSCESKNSDLLIGIADAKRDLSKEQKISDVSTKIALKYKSKLKKRNKLLLILLPIAIIPYLKYIPQ